MTDAYTTADELIAKYGSAVDAILAVNIEAMNIGAAMQLMARMAKEIAEQAKALAVSDKGWEVIEPTPEETDLKYVFANPYKS